MKKTILILAATIILCFNSSILWRGAGGEALAQCSASITASPYSCDSGTMITFNGTAGAGTVYQWDFDGGTATTLNPACQPDVNQLQPIIDFIDSTIENAMNNKIPDTGTPFFSTYFSWDTVSKFYDQSIMPFTLNCMTGFVVTNVLWDKDTNQVTNINFAVYTCNYVERCGFQYRPRTNGFGCDSIFTYPPAGGWKIDSLFDIYFDNDGGMHTDIVGQAATICRVSVIGSDLCSKIIPNGQIINNNCLSIYDETIFLYPTFNSCRLDPGPYRVDWATEGTKYVTVQFADSTCNPNTDTVVVNVVKDSCPITITKLSSNKTEGCYPLMVTLSANAYGATYNVGDSLIYSWYVGDGNVLTTKGVLDSNSYSSSTAIYTYNASGTYSLQLIVTGPDGQSDTMVKYNYIVTQDTCPPPPPQPAMCCIKGRVYQDLDGDCNYDGGEPFQQKWLVQLFKDSLYYNWDKPDESGWYNFNFLCDSNATYTVRIDPFWYWWQWDAVCPPSQVYYNVKPIADSCLMLDFGVDTIAATSEKDLAVTTDALYSANPGYQQMLTVGVCNKGNVTQSGTLLLVHDPNYTYNSASPVPDAVSGDTLKWNFTNLAPGQCFVTYSYLTVSASAVNGQQLWYQGIAEPIAGDITPYNNIDTGIVIVGAPYDPNDKLSSPGGVSGKILPSTQELSYTINFQNTGTAPAYNIVLLDTLPVNEIDLGSIRFGASSFPYDIDFFGNGVLKFTFANIMLPDSNADEVGSHGFVQYTAKLKSNLPIGTQIKNRAGIYFDFQPVVLTEYAINTIDTNLTGMKQISNIQYQASLNLYPNPAKNEVVIFYSSYQPPTNNYKLQIGIFNLLGELISEKKITANRASTIDVSELKGGIYFVRATTDKNSPVKKLVIVK